MCHNYSHNQMFEYYQAWAPLEKFCNEDLKKYAKNSRLIPIRVQICTICML